MSTEDLLDGLLRPRPNGSSELEGVATLIETTLRQHAPEVHDQAFLATPYGFQLLWSAAFALMLVWMVAVLRGRHRVALSCIVVVPLLLFVETEWLWSPVSGLWLVLERNIVGVFPGRPGGPTLVFSAHYDTATQFGDHFTWSTWGMALLPALILAWMLTLTSLWRSRRQRNLRLALGAPLAGLVLIPFAGMAWFFGVGPLLRVPSPGAEKMKGNWATLNPKDAEPQEAHHHDSRCASRIAHRGPAPQSYSERSRRAAHPG